MVNILVVDDEPSVRLVVRTTLETRQYAVQVAETGHQALITLREELLAYPGVPARLGTATAGSAEHPVINMHLKKGDLSLVFFSAMSFISRARDITLQELKIEYFFPADAVTEQFTRRLAGTPETVAV